MANNLEVTEEQIRAEVSAAIKAAGSRKSWSASANVSLSTICAFLRGMAPTPAILTALGLEREARYVYRRINKEPPDGRQTEGQ